jgi:hypothetical protein
MRNDALHSIHHKSEAIMNFVDRLRELLKQNPKARVILKSSLTGLQTVMREFESSDPAWMEFRSTDEEFGLILVSTAHVVGLVHNRKYDRLLVQLAA